MLICSYTDFYCHLRHRKLIIIYEWRERAIMSKNNDIHIELYARTNELGLSNINDITLCLPRFGGQFLNLVEFFIDSTRLKNWPSCVIKIVKRTRGKSLRKIRSPELHLPQRKITTQYIVFI